MGGLGGILGPSWAGLGRSWGPLGRSWGGLGRSWSDLGRFNRHITKRETFSFCVWAPRGHLKSSWEPLGPILGRLGALLGRSWGALGLSWADLKLFWNELGAILGGLGPLGAMLERSWAVLGWSLAGVTLIQDEYFVVVIVWTARQPVFYSFACTACTV